jgi:putative MATE family efflux protein
MKPQIHVKEMDSKAHSREKKLDFTQGSIAKKMAVFALPTFFGNLLQSSYQFIDSLWVGNLLGAEALGAVSISSPVIFSILAFIIGINGATLTILSQQKGRNDEAGLRESLNAFVFILGLLAVLLGIVGFLAAKPILVMLGTPEEILPLAAEYLKINFLGILFLFGYNFIGTVLRALGDSRTPVRFVMIAVVLNTVLDPLLISVFQGITGAALATVISQGLAFLYGLSYSLRHRTVPFTIPHLPGKRYAKAVFKTGLPGGLQMIAVSSGQVAIMSVIASFDKEVVAGFGAAQRIENLIMLPALTLGSAVTSMAGQNIGANLWNRVTQIARVGTGYIAVLSLSISIIVFFSAEVMIRWFVNDPETIAFGTEYLRSVAFFFPFLGVNFILNGIARSSGAMVQVLMLNIVSFWLLRYPLSFLFSRWLGESGIAYGIGVSFVISAAIAAGYYFFGGWRKTRIFDDE